MNLLSPLPTPVDERPATKWSSSFVQKQPPKDSFVPPAAISDSNRKSLHKDVTKSVDHTKKLAEARDKHKSTMLKSNH